MLLLYLVYLKLIKHVNIPSWFFILFGIAYSMFVGRMIFLDKKDKRYIQILDYKTIHETPMFIEHTFISIVYILTGIYLIIK